MQNNILLFGIIRLSDMLLHLLPLQFLLSQAHRLQALELLGRFLDLGPWAVHSALSVGIFPYVLKLLGSKLRELQPILVFIWAKILAVDTVRWAWGGPAGVCSVRTCLGGVQFVFQYVFCLRGNS